MTDLFKNAGTSTRDRILDAAELLFAERGPDAVSMRDIAGSAGVRLSLLTYHLGSKESLYQAVFARRAGQLARARSAGLDGVLGRSDPTTREVIAAFVGPSVRLRFEEGAHGAAFALLTAREAVDPREATRGILAEHFDPTARRFINALSMLYPRAKIECLAEAYMFCVGTLVVTMVSGDRLGRLARQKTAAKPERIHDFGALMEGLVDFCTGGVESIVAGQSRAVQGRKSKNPSGRQVARIVRAGAGPQGRRLFRS